MLPRNMTVLTAVLAVLASLQFAAPARADTVRFPWMESSSAAKPRTVTPAQRAARQAFASSRRSELAPRREQAPCQTVLCGQYIVLGLGF